MMNQGPEAGLFLFSFLYFLFLYVIFGHSPKIVGEIRGVFIFGGTLAWVTSPSWPPQNRRLDSPVVTKFFIEMGVQTAPPPCRNSDLTSCVFFADFEAE